MLDRRQLASGWVVTLAILIMALGIVHAAMALRVMSHPAVTMLPAEWEHMFLFMYLGTNAAIVFAGMLLLVAARGLRVDDRDSWTLAWRIALFLLVLGVGALTAMLTNPFAQLLLAFALLLIFAMLWFRPVFRPRTF